VPPASLDSPRMAPPPTEIRVVGREAAAEIAAVKVAGWRTTYAQWVSAAVLEPYVDEGRVAERIAQSLDDPANLARADGATVGIATCLRGGREEPLLDSLHVLPPARGRGIGTELIGALATELVARGETALTVACVEQNVRARQLYERLGAQRTGVAPSAWAPDEINEVWYRWPRVAELCP
jgi:GNAT superfamily N-acetyltransferase